MNTSASGHPGVSTPFIHRPVATTLFGVALLLAGWLAYLRLPVASLPEVDFPTIQVMTQLPGASPESMAELVTGPLERTLGQIPGVATMTSTSSFGISQITLQFVLERNIDAAAQDVQSAINAASSALPRTLPYPPVYAKVNPADAPIVTLALTSATLSLRQLSDAADTIIAQRLAMIAGVGKVTVEGGIRPAIRIQADLARLSSYGISMAELRQAIAAANVSGPKGVLDGRAQSYTIASNDQITDAATYASIVVAFRNGAPVLLSDVAQVVDGLENRRVGSWYQGAPAVIIHVQRQPGANVIETVRRLVEEVPRIQRALPAGARIELVHDRTEMIKASVRDVQFTLVLATLLVVMVVLVFLRSARATVIAGIALPLSIVATFAVMWLFGYSLNNLSLMALTIGTGFVVDDAIVMIENIVRHIEKGQPPLRAALDGAREIGFTIISLTASLVAVFIPMLFMTGLVGRMFREFAMTLTIAVIVSAVVSLTLTPMICARLLRPSHDDTRRDGPSHNSVYMRSLRFVLQHRLATLLVTIGTFALTTWMYIVVPKGFLPLQDTGMLSARMLADPTSSHEEMVRLQAALSERLRADPAVKAVAASIGVSQLNSTPNAAHFTITLHPRHSRDTDITAIAARLETQGRSIPGVNLYLQAVQDVQIGTRRGTGQYQFSLTGPDTAEVNRWAERLEQKLDSSGLFQNLSTDVTEGGLRAFVNVDRETAARLGVSMLSINEALNDAFGQRQISTIYQQTNQYRVVLEALPDDQSSLASLERIFVTGAQGIQIPLLSVATVERARAALSVNHQEQFPAATLSFDLARDVALGDAVELIEAAQRDLGMPGSIVGSFSGDAAEFRRSLASQPLLILAAIITIYIVLGMLYESFVHPLTILTTLPSAGIGALLALQLTGLDLSIVALIGIILLMGIVKKNAIIMIDFALEAERKKGMTAEAAIVEACRLRFRPIMMTTLAALLGALPLALESGTGSELRYPLGVTVIGGLLLSQLLTLYTTPVIYLYLDRLRSRMTRPGAAHLPAPSTTPGALGSSSGRSPAE